MQQFILTERLLCSVTNQLIINRKAINLIKKIAEC